MGRFHEIFIGDVSMTIDMDCIVLGYIYKQKVGPTGAADHIYIYIQKRIFHGDIFHGTYSRIWWGIMGLTPKIVALMISSLTCWPIGYPPILDSLGSLQLVVSEIWKPQNNIITDHDCSHFQENWALDILHCLRIRMEGLALCETPLLPMRRHCDGSLSCSIGNM